MNRRIPVTALSAALASVLLAACAGRPTTPPELVRLDQQLSNIQADSRVVANAPDLVRDAAIAVEALHRDNRRLRSEEFSQRVYLADRLIRTAEAEGLAGYASQRQATLAQEREALGREAAERRLQMARTQRDIAREEALRQATVAHSAQQQADQARQQAEFAQIDAEIARQQAAQLGSELEALKARQTDTGWSMTLGDVLFEVDRAELKPGATRQLEALASVLLRNPNASVRIEGHTDSTGSAAYNRDLSRRRAESVQAFLLRQGVEPGRIEAQGLGADFPVASNADPAGRTQNRRVDLLIDTGTPIAASGN
jgi:outer membrane protein OmpA-like peptidoglycan-associated protein